MKRVLFFFVGTIALALPDTGWREDGITIYGLIGTTPQHREKELERARKTIRYATEALIEKSSDEERAKWEKQLGLVAEVAAVLESDSQRELYNDFLASLKVFEIPLRSGSGMLHLELFQKFALFLRSDDERDSGTLTAKNLRRLLQTFLMDPANGFASAFPQQFKEHMWEWVDHGESIHWARRLGNLVMRPEVVLGAVCAASLLSFSVGRLWDTPTPSPHMRDAVEQRIEKAPAPDPASEDAARQLGKDLAPYLP